MLLHGGEGWVTGDTVTVTLDSAAGVHRGGGNATYTVRVEITNQLKSMLQFLQWRRSCTTRAYAF